MIRTVGDSTYHSSEKKLELFLIISIPRGSKCLPAGECCSCPKGRGGPVSAMNFSDYAVELLFAQAYRCGCSLISFKKSSTICSCEYRGSQPHSWRALLSSKRTDSLSRMGCSAGLGWKSICAPGILDRTMPA